MKLPVAIRRKFAAWGRMSGKLKSSAKRRAAKRNAQRGGKLPLCPNCERKMRVESLEHYYCSGCEMLYPRPLPKPRAAALESAFYV